MTQLREHGPSDHSSGENESVARCERQLKRRASSYRNGRERQTRWINLYGGRIVSMKVIAPHRRLAQGAGTIRAREQWSRTVQGIDPTGAPIGVFELTANRSGRPRAWFSVIVDL